MSIHVRQQILEYFKQYLVDELGSVICDIHRTAPINIESRAHLNLVIDDETTGGDDSSDEIEDTLEAQSRIAPLIVEITVTTDTARADVNALAGYVELAMSGDESTGDHVINDALVSSQYIATTSEQEDEGHQDQVTLSLVFQTSYRTAPGDPFTLI